MHGRSGFLIHGDNARGDASEGCIILPRYYRQMISRLGVRDLFVIDRHRLDCAAVQACGIAGTCVVPGAMCNEAEGCAAFLRISLKAEALYEAALAARPGLLFEDHLQPMLAAAGRGLP